MAGVEGPLNTGQIDALQQSGIHFSPDSAVGKAFNGKTVIIVDPTVTEGLRGNDSDPEAGEIVAKTSIKDRTIVKAGDHETKSIRLSDFVPGSVKAKAGKAKELVTTKAQEAAEFVSTKAQTLKSKTIGNLLRAIRNESFQQIKADTVSEIKSQEFHKLVDEHNSAVEELATLKQGLKAENQKIKEFESQYKEALELLDKPEKFTDKSKKTVFVQLPVGEERKIESFDTTSRREDAKSIADEFRDSKEYKEYRELKLQQKKGGTETFKTRELLKKGMKVRAEKMLEIQAQELKESDDTKKEGLSDRRNAARKKRSDAVIQKGQKLGAKLEAAREQFGKQREDLSTTITDRSRLKENLKSDEKEVRRLEKDAVDSRRMGRKSRSKNSRSHHFETAQKQEKGAQKLRSDIEQSKNYRKQLKSNMSEVRTEQIKIKKEVKELESGEALKKATKSVDNELKTEEKNLRREEKEIDQATKKKKRSLGSQLGRRR